MFSIRIKQSKMPKVKRSRKPPPDGWELIEPTLDELDQKMREGEPVEEEDRDHFAVGLQPQRAACADKMATVFTSRCVSMLIDLNTINPFSPIFQPVNPWLVFVKGFFG